MVPRMILAGAGTTAAGALFALFLTAGPPRPAAPQATPTIELAALSTLIPSASDTTASPIVLVQAPAVEPKAAPAQPNPKAAAPEAAAPEPVANDGPTRIGVLGTGATVANEGRDLKVDAPHAKVKVDKDAGKVWVQAPHTDVKVDPDNGRVRVRAPYVNLDIRW